MAGTEDVSRIYYGPEVDRTREGLQVDPRKHELDPYYPNAKAPAQQTQYLDISPPSKRNGPSWLIFGVAIAVVAAIVGGAIGGGLGSSLAKCNNNLRDCSVPVTPTSCNETASVSNQLDTATGISESTGTLPFATTTSGLILNYVAEPTGRVYNIATDCENISDGQIRPPSSGVFSLYCNKDIAWGGVAKQTGANGEVLTIIDIMGSISYSLTDCVQSCAVFNSKAEAFGREDRCRSITFDSNLNAAFLLQQANCWLKNGSVSSADNMVDSEGSVSAVMVLGYGEGGVG